jgi:DNA polymerase delta subunit 1
METAIVQPYDWTIKYSESNNEYDELRAWCLDRENKTYLIRYLNFPCSCYVEIPEQYVSMQGFANNLLQSVKKALQPWKKDEELDDENEESRKPFLLNAKVVKKPCLYYSKLSTFLYLEIRNGAAMKRMKSRCNKYGVYVQGMKTPIKLNVWEDDISNIRKLLTKQKCTYCQWMKISGTQILNESEKVSTVTHEYISNWTTLTPISSEETIGWMTSPSLFSFDIECYSSNKNRMPLKTNATDVITMISCNYMRVGNPSSAQSHMIVVGKCRDIPGANVYIVSDETECLEKMCELITKLDPEILIGYNILSFDIPYIDQRFKRQLNEWPTCSRLKNEVPFVKKETWYSEAYGHQTNYLLKMSGRFCIDVMPVIQRDYKLRKYSLDYVSKYFLGQGKHDVKPAEMFAIYERLIGAKTQEEIEEATDENTKVAAYCIQDADLVLKLFAKLNIWIATVEMSNIVGVTPVDIYTRGQQVKCNSQIYDEVYNLGYVMDLRGEAYPYKGAYVQEPIPGIYDNTVVVDFASLYPSIIRAYNICYTTLVPKHLHDRVPDEQCHVFEFDEEFDEKKLTAHPKSEEADDVDVEESDSSSSEDESDNEDDKEKKKRKKICVVHYKFKFYKSSVKLGIMPQLVAKLVSERKKVKKLMEQEKDNNGKNTLQYTIYDKRQLSLKVSGNSMYGFLGVQNGKRPLIEGAISITYMGRMLIKEVNEFVTEKHGYKTVYNDTDSAFIDVSEKDGKKAFQIGKMLEHEINQLFVDRKPLSMEFEKLLGKLLLIKKKKYAYLPIDEQGKFMYNSKDGKIIIETKGITLSRRDNCAMLTELYSTCLEKILLEKPVYDVADVILQTIEKLAKNKINVSSLSINKSMGSNYKSKTAQMKIFGDEMRKRGVIIVPGERVDFVIVNTEHKDDKIGMKMRLVEQMQNSNETIDTEYYLTKVLKNPIDQLFTVGYNELWKENEESSKLYFKHQRRHKVMFCSLIKTVINMLDSGKSLVFIRNNIMNTLVKLE